MMEIKNSENAEYVGPCSSGMTSLGSLSAPIRKRRYSTAKIQPTRVKRVMQSDDEIGRMVASVPVAIGRAMEHFAEKLLQAAAQCVHYPTSRTLSPPHMKQAMMQNPHFMFLEPLMREIPLPASAISELQWMTADCVEQPSVSGLHSPGPSSSPSCCVGMLMSTLPLDLPKLPKGGNLLGIKRKQINGEVDGNETKPKRGRPKKVRKGSRCVDDSLFLDEQPLSNYMKNNSTALPNGSILTDRELMPPPPVLPIRSIASVAPSTKRNFPTASPNLHSIITKTNNINNGKREITMEKLNCLQPSSPLTPLSLSPSLQTSSDRENNAA